ncbi:MAG: DUF4402 domain-containing protein [Ignavibacteriales bacterium]|nr:DUF4402 domain-containing protein [Ignavibacteriales bacterium]
MSKKLIVLLILISTIELFSQSNFTSSANVSISINNGLAISKVGGDLDFGDLIYTGNRQTLTRSPDLGVEFVVTGNRRNRVSVSFPNRINLDNNDWVNINGGPSGTIRFSPNVRHTNGNINYVGSKKVNSGTSYRLSNDSPNGKLYLWVGGGLLINRNQPYGAYKGTFTITVEY